MRPTLEIQLKQASLAFHKIHTNSIYFDHVDRSGPSCSKLMMSLVNDSLKFTSSDTQIC